jgi:hypothetical protein
MGRIARRLFGPWFASCDERGFISSEIGLVEGVERPATAAGMAEKAGQMEAVTAVADELEQGLGFRG